MTQRILLLIGGHLCTDPRAQKEASFLAATGYSVTVAGKWDDQTLADWDNQIATSAPYEYIPVLDMRPDKKLVRFNARIARRTAALFGHFFSLGYGTWKMYRFARSFQADLTIAHCESALGIVLALAKNGSRIAVDFEDWFSRDLPLTARSTVEIELLKDLEREILARATFTTCPSGVMADALHKEYGGNKPVAIQNVFDPIVALPSLAKPTEIEPKTPLKIVWFSQTLGRGRGLESFFNALHEIHFPVAVTLIGRCSETMRNFITESIPKSPSLVVTIRAPVPPWELTQLIATYDAGLAIEQNEIRSTQLTASNKYYQYIAAGIAVIATNTEGQSEAWSAQTPPGLLVEAGSVPELANALQHLHTNPDFLSACKENSRRLAIEYDPARSIKDTFISLIEEALGA